jgi:hypothetical protein
MAVAYTPGLKVSPQTQLRIRRSLPISGEVKVSIGQKVQPQQVVAETLLPGNVYPLNISKMLSIPPAEVPGALLKKQGDYVKVGETLARSKGIFGFFKNELASKYEGQIESISKVTGQVILRGEPLPVQVKAFLNGTIVEVIPNEGVVIEAETTFIQGIFGVGGETYGQIKVATKSAEEALTPDLLEESMRGKIVIGGGRMTYEAVYKAIDLGIAALVCGGIDDQDLKAILGYDLGVAVTGSEKIGITLIITEGFGDITMARRTYELLKSREGADAAVNGATQIRAGVMRPEIVVPIDPKHVSKNAIEDTSAGGGVMEVGVSVRVIRDPYFGILGKVKALPHEPVVLESGSHARILQVETLDGKVLTVPRANVELITR